MTRRQMLTALFGAAVLALPVAGCGHQPVQDEPGAELILRYAENQPRIILLRRRRWPLRILWPSAPMAA